MSYNNNEFNQGVSDTRSMAFAVFFKLILPLVIVGSIAGGCLHFACKPMQVLDKVTDPDRMIYTYEHFHDLYQRCQAADRKILSKIEQVEMFKDMAPEGWRRDSNLSREWHYLQVELMGLKEHRANIVAEYNADSAKMTRSFLRDNSLPESLDY